MLQIDKMSSILGDKNLISTTRVRVGDIKLSFLVEVRLNAMARTKLFTVPEVFFGEPGINYDNTVGISECGWDICCKSDVNK